MKIEVSEIAKISLEKDEILIISMKRGEEDVAKQIFEIMGRKWPGLSKKVMLYCGGGMKFTKIKASEIAE